MGRKQNVRGEVRCCKRERDSSGCVLITDVGVEKTVIAEGGIRFPSYNIELYTIVPFLAYYSRIHVI